MHTCVTNLEDSENNRCIDVKVTYVATPDRFEVKEIVPTRVTFLCPTSRQPLRAINIHRDMARSMLVRHLEEKGHVDRLKSDLMVQHSGIA